MFTLYFTVKEEKKSYLKAFLKIISEGIRSSHLMAEYVLMAGSAESVLQHSTLHTATKNNCDVLTDLLAFFISKIKRGHEHG